MVRQRFSANGHLVSFWEVVDGYRRARAGSDGIVRDRGDDAGQHAHAGIGRGKPIDGDGRGVAVVARRAGAHGTEGIVGIIVGGALLLVLVPGEDGAPTRRLPRLVGHFELVLSRGINFVVKNA